MKKMLLPFLLLICINFSIASASDRQGGYITEPYVKNESTGMLDVMADVIHNTSQSNLKRFTVKEINVLGPDSKPYVIARFDPDILACPSWVNIPYSYNAAFPVFDASTLKGKHLLTTLMTAQANNLDVYVSISPLRSGITGSPIIPEDRYVIDGITLVKTNSQ